MAARKRISEVSITSGGQYTGNMSAYCPYASDNEMRDEWFEFLLTELLRPQTGGAFKLPLDEAGREHILIDRGLITNIVITLA